MSVAWSKHVSKQKNVLPVSSIRQSSIHQTASHETTATHLHSINKHRGQTQGQHQVSAEQTAIRLLFFLLQCYITYSFTVLMKFPLYIIIE